MCGINLLTVAALATLMAKPKPPDPKAHALRQRGSLNPRPETVADPLFATSDFFDARDLVQVKYEMVRRVRVDGQPVSRSAAAFGVLAALVLSGAGARSSAGGWPRWCRGSRGRGAPTSSTPR